LPGSPAHSQITLTNLFQELDPAISTNRTTFFRAVRP
jgi:hypothetical protein